MDTVIDRLVGVAVARSAGADTAARPVSGNRGGADQDIESEKTPSGISIPAAYFFETVSGLAVGDASTIFAGCTFGDFSGDRAIARASIWRNFSLPETQAASSRACRPSNMQGSTLLRGGEQRLELGERSIEKCVVELGTALFG
jgi:hypothetical protein